jgi:hypothetical protein
MRTSLIGFVLLALTGCATTEVQRIAKQYDEHVYALWRTRRASSSCRAIARLP